MIARNGQMGIAFQLPDADLIDFVGQVYGRENPRVSGGSATTLDDYRTQVANLQAYFSLHCQAAGQPVRAVRLSDLTDSLLAGAMGWMISPPKSLSVETANKLRRSIVAFQRFAVMERDFPAKLLRVKKMKVPKRRPKAWPIADINRILTAASRLEGHVGPTPAGDWFVALLLFIFNTGTRISAAMLTPSKGLNLERGWVLVPAEVQKQDADQEFDLLPITVSALKKIKAGHRARLFDDWPLDRTVRSWPALTHRLRQILVSANLYTSIDEIPRRDLFHKWRRCFASYVASKAGKAVAQEFLGHSCSSVTDRYLDDEIMTRPMLRDLLPEPKIEPLPPAA